MNLEKTLGGIIEIRNNTNALIKRIEYKPFINQNSQPVIYSFLAKMASKKGMTVMEYQRSLDAMI